MLILFDKICALRPIYYELGLINLILEFCATETHKCHEAELRFCFNALCSPVQRLRRGDKSCTDRRWT